MKNNLLKFYIVAVYLCSTFVLFAQPGTTDTGGTLENADTPPAPIDENLWMLALTGLIFVFLRLKAIQVKKSLVK
jgi:hypothetical protein